MLQQVVRVKHRDTVDGGDEARHDARRCIDALRKRWPGIEFVGQPGKSAGEFLIRVELDQHSSLTLEGFKLFAEGFMASAFLWER